MWAYYNVCVSYGHVTLLALEACRCCIEAFAALDRQGYPASYPTLVTNAIAVDIRMLLLLCPDNPSRVIHTTISGIEQLRNYIRSGMYLD